MKRLTAALLLIPSLSFGTKIVSQQTGNWGDTASWVGSVVPGNGDEVSLFHVIQATDTRTIGVSVTTGSIAINLNSTGTIHITGAGHLIQRGYGTYTAGAGNLNDAVIVDSGTAWEFDASASSSPTTIHYGFFPSGNTGYRKFKISGSSWAYASIYNTDSSTTALLGENSLADGGVYELYYASVTRMKFESALNNAVGSHASWSAQFSSFTSCDVINLAAGGNLYSTGTIRHEFNYHQNTLNGNAIRFVITSFKGPEGIRSIKNNFFDETTQMCSNCAMGDFTIQNNYFGNEYNNISASWSLFTNNFISVTQAPNSTVGGTMSDSYFWWNQDQQNPHVITVNISSSVAMTGMMWGQSGTSRTSGADDSGELYLQGTPGNISTYTLTNSILLPNGRGYSSLEITSLLGTASPASYTFNKAILEHNTWFGGFDNSATAPFAAVDYSESSNMAPGTLVSFKSNLTWNTAISTLPAQYFKVFDFGNQTTNLSQGYAVGPTTDVCSPSACDYNSSYGGLVSSAAGTNAARYLNQGRGYAGNFSSTPGVHDVDNANPNFVDYHRNFEKFDSAYWRPHFGISQPATWSSGGSYVDGDYVAASSSTLYWGDTINYVHVSSGFCVGNPQPGAYPITSWGKCWQFASINDFKQAVLSSMTFTDATIGATNSDVNQTLLKWVRAGFHPTNSSLKSTAHDGGDIGAMSVLTGGAGRPVLNISSNPVATVGGTVQFVTTMSVTYGLTSGSMGSIDQNGLYTAPTTYFTPKNILAQGCPGRPNDDIINTRIDALPVDTNSAVRFAHHFTTNGGSNTIVFEPTMPTNLYNNTTNITSMTFRTTHGADGSFPMLSTFTRLQEGSVISNDPTFTTQDHHIIGVSSNTCLAAEQYNFYNYGLDTAVPGSNSTSGWQYYTNNYYLPDTTFNAAGGSDAAGMAIQPILLRFSELRAGSIQHALRMTTNNANLYNTSISTAGYVWPATSHAQNNNCTNQVSCFPYGARLRLKSTVDCTQFSTTGGQAVCTALKNYGVFLVDGGTKFGISTDYNMAESTQNFAATFSTLQSTWSTQDFEQVDESSLMISSFTGNVNPSNAYIAPDNYAQVVVTNQVDGSSRTISIAIQPVTVGFANPAHQGLNTGINVMAGTPQFQIPYWVQGASDTAAACSMTPTVGSLTSGCLYTAPATQFNQLLITTVTVTSNIDPNHGTVSFPLVVFSSDGIRIRMGPAISTLDTIPPYDNNGVYADSTTGVKFFEDPVNSIPGWTQRIIQGSNTYANQLYNNADYGSEDKAWSFMVPNGSWTLTTNFASKNVLDITTSSNCLETQGVVYQSTFSLASTLAEPVVKTTYTVVTNNRFYWAIRGNDYQSHNFISYFTLTPTPPFPAITSALTASGTQGYPFSYQMTANNSPTSYAASGLPSGLSVNTGTGLISGSPTVSGTYNVTLTATNTAGTGPPSTLAITLNPLLPFKIRFR
jgi:hypothetical protein